MTPLLIFITAVCFLLLLYVFILRPWHLHWGATNSEIELSLPGDSLVPRTNFNATRGVSIMASPETIWKWIVQIGSKRAGWYSIDWIDNGGIKSSDVILPQYQSIEVGQFIPFTPDQKNGMWVKEFEENKYILWVDKDGMATWLWYMIPSPTGETRLLTRLRTKYNLKGFWIIYYIIYDFGDIVMMRRCMKGIKSRAELTREIHRI